MPHRHVERGRGVRWSEALTWVRGPEHKRAYSVPSAQKPRAAPQAPQLAILRWRSQRGESRSAWKLSALARMAGRAVPGREEGFTHYEGAPHL